MSKTRFVAVRIGWSLLLMGLALVLSSAVLNEPAPVQAAVSPAAAGLRVLESNDQHIILELDTPEYGVRDASESAGRYQQLEVRQADRLTAPGKPELPKFSALLGIPAQGGVSIRILRDDVQLLAGHYQILPSMRPAPPSGDLQPGAQLRMPDPTAYADPQLYPQAVARVMDTAWLRDQRLARIEIYPFQFRASTGGLVWHRQVQIEVVFEGTGKTNQLTAAPSADGPFEQMLRTDILNYDIARQWRAQPATPHALTRPEILAPRYKITVDHDGLYRITYNDLAAAGLAMSSFDPRHLHMTNQGLDVAIEVTGENDGRFDPGDTLQFYGQRLRGDSLASKFSSESAHWPQLGPLNWQPTFNAFMVERYTDQNVYWLSIESTNGLRMAARAGTPSGSAPQADFFTSTVRAEQSKLWRTNTFTGEDPFFWDSLTASGAPVTGSYTITLSNVANTSLPATVQGDVVANATNWQAAPDHRTQVVMNNAPTPLEDQTWDGPIRHHFKGQVPATELGQGVNTLNFVVIPQPALLVDNIFFDWFEVSYPRRFQAEQGQLFFNSERQGATQYNITGLMTKTVTAWDISNPWLPQRIVSPTVAGSGNTYTASVELNQSVPITVAVGDETAWQKPQSLTLYAPADDLKSTSNGADYIIITPRAFYTSSQTLAAYRAAQGLRVKVVDLDDVINQFTDGIYHSIAIKAFLQYAYQKWQRPAPTYVVLVGDGHWNFKGYTVSTQQGTAGSSPIYMPPHLVWVDPWQGEVDSSNELAAVSGDDILPDMLIGRMPVNSAAELDVIISKTIAYEALKPQAWQHRLAFVADNIPDGAGDFVASAENAIHSYAPSYMAIDRLYLNDYCGNPSNSPCPVMNYALTRTLNLTGSLLVNYVGHAGTNRWANEQIFVNANVSTLQNLARLPIILSLDCLDGYWFHPITTTQAALMEVMLRAPNGGAAATFSPVGLGVATGHDVLQRGFYKVMFAPGAHSLGSAALGAKLELYAAGHDYDLIDTFTVFGDPALHLPRLLDQQVYLPIIRR